MLFRKTHRSQAGAQFRCGGGIERENDFGMTAECGQHFQFRIRQRVKSIQPDGAHAAQSFRGDAGGSQLQAPRAQREAAAFERGLDLFIYGEKGRGQRRIGKVPAQVLAVAASRGEFLESARQRSAEAGEVRHLAEFGAIDPPHCFFDGQVDQGIGRLNRRQSPR